MQRKICFFVAWRVCNKITEALEALPDKNGFLFVNNMKSERFKASHFSLQAFTRELNCKMTKVYIMLIVIYTTEKNVNLATSLRNTKLSLSVGRCKLCSVWNVRLSAKYFFWFASHLTPRSRAFHDLIIRHNKNFPVHQHVISFCVVCALLSIQVMRIWKIINCKMLFWYTTKFSERLMATFKSWHWNDLKPRLHKQLSLKLGV